MCWRVQYIPRQLPGIAVPGQALRPVCTRHAVICSCWPGLSNALINSSPAQHSLFIWYKGVYVLQRRACNACHTTLLLGAGAAESWERVNLPWVQDRTLLQGYRSCWFRCGRNVGKYYTIQWLLACVCSRWLISSHTGGAEAAADNG